MQDFKQNTIQMMNVTWQTHERELRFIRSQVFMQEQHVSEALEWDGLDESASHILAAMKGCHLGCARVLIDGTIGRMAVLSDFRHRGVGKLLLQAALEICATQGNTLVKLSAQTHALDFYRKFGFETVSTVYLDAGIPHQDMQRYIY